MSNESMSKSQLLHWVIRQAKYQKQQRNTRKIISFAKGNLDKSANDTTPVYSQVTHMRKWAQSRFKAKKKNHWF